MNLEINIDRNVVKHGVVVNGSTHSLERLREVLDAYYQADVDLPADIQDTMREMVESFKERPSPLTGTYCPPAQLFPNGLTVAEFKPIVAHWPEEDSTGKKMEVWVCDHNRLSIPVRRIMPIDAQYKAGYPYISTANLAVGPA